LGKIRNIPVERKSLTVELQQIFSFTILSISYRERDMLYHKKHANDIERGKIHARETSCMDIVETLLFANEVRSKSGELPKYPGGIGKRSSDIGHPGVQPNAI
jgi:hypothetical protein